MARFTAASSKLTLALLLGVGGVLPPMFARSAHADEADPWRQSFGAGIEGAANLDHVLLGAHLEWTPIRFFTLAGQAGAARTLTGWDGQASFVPRVRVIFGRSALALGLGVSVAPFNQLVCDSGTLFCTDPAWEATYTAGWFVAQASFEHRWPAGTELRAFLQSETIVTSPMANACFSVPCDRFTSLAGTTLVYLGLAFGFTLYP